VFPQGGIGGLVYWAEREWVTGVARERGCGLLCGGMVKDKQAGEYGGGMILIAWWQGTVHSDHLEPVQCCFLATCPFTLEMLEPL
jgi:hypothetical protein